MKYKITLTISFLFCCILWSTSQNQPKISLLEYSNEANYKKEHTHKLQIENKSLKQVLYTINVTNELCKNQKAIETKLNYSLYDENMNEIQNQLLVLPNSKKVFYIKLIKPYNSKLGSWNCIQIQINEPSPLASSRKAPLSDKLIIKSFIPNQNNDN